MNALTLSPTKRLEPSFNFYELARVGPVREACEREFARLVRIVGDPDDPGSVRVQLVGIVEVKDMLSFTLKTRPREPVQGPVAVA